MVAKQELEQAADAVEQWLAAVDADDSELSEVDVEELWEISTLARAGASDAEVGVAVRQALHCGWSWSPIARLLCVSREEAMSRYGTPPVGQAPQAAEESVRIPSARRPTDELAGV
jgi:hypothetical protein